MICLHWFSPLPPARTGIADYTANLLPYFQERGARVVLWTDQSKWEPSLEQYAPVRRFSHSRLAARDLAEASQGCQPVPVYHIGNNGAFHEGIWEASRRVPGISVLHDSHLQHLFAHIIRDRQHNRELYQRVMRQYYGNQGAEAADALWNGAISTEDVAERFPLAAYGAAGSLASITHAEYGVDLLCREGYFAAHSLNFPYACNGRPAPRTAAPPFRIAVCGYLGPNRRLDSFLNAFAKFERRNKFAVEIYGPVWDPAYIGRVVEENGLQKLVTFHGFTPMAELDRALKGVHLAVNLRFPTMGEASMTQLQLWSHGIPAMVTPVGWYSNLPADSVLFVRPTAEVEDIQKHLRAFLNSPTHFAEVGAAGRAAVEDLHRPARYIDDLLGVASSCDALAAETALSATARRVGSELQSWCPPDAFSSLGERLVRELASWQNSIRKRGDNS